MEGGNIGDGALNKLHRGRFDSRFLLRRNGAGVHRAVSQEALLVQANNRGGIAAAFSSTAYLQMTML